MISKPTTARAPAGATTAVVFAAGLIEEGRTELGVFDSCQ